MVPYERTPQSFIDGNRGIISCVSSGFVDDRTAPVGVVNKIVLVLAFLMYYLPVISEELVSKRYNPFREIEHGNLRLFNADIVCLSFSALHEDLVITDHGVGDVAECPRRRSVREHTYVSTREDVASELRQHAPVRDLPTRSIVVERTGNLDREVVLTGKIYKQGLSVAL